MFVIITPLITKKLSGKEFLSNLIGPHVPSFVRSMLISKLKTGYFFINF